VTVSYGARPVKRRRRTGAELGEVDDAIIAAVEEDSPVTLRGVYYRTVSAGAVPKTEAGYRLVGRQLLKLRRDGVVPYSDITDGTRWISKPETWSNVEEMLEDTVSSYRKALWHDQDVDVHIFTEKDAISGVILPVTKKWDVPLGVLRGYASESFTHSVAQVINWSSKRRVYVYQLGDHDPSGVDAWRSFREGVAGFLGERVTAEMIRDADPDLFGLGSSLTVGRVIGVSEAGPDEDFAGDWDEQVTYRFVGADDDVKKVTFARLAVTEDQIEEWGLATRPTKKTDTRAKQFTGESVEVDAIRAPQLRELLEDAIVSHIDGERLSRFELVQDAERESVLQFVGAWGARA
jgi:hypothetical protein